MGKDCNGKSRNQIILFNKEQVKIHSLTSWYKKKNCKEIWWFLIRTTSIFPKFNDKDTNNNKLLCVAELFPTQWIIFAQSVDIYKR